MSVPSERDYYIRRRAKLLRAFDRVARRMTNRLTERYDAAFADEVITETRAEFDRIIPALPYIGGGRNIFTWVIVVNGWIIAFYRAMHVRGKSAEDAVRICAEVSDELFRSWPATALRLAGKLAFGRVAMRVLRKQAERSQERRYGDDFVYRFVEGGADDWALVFDECAVNKFYEAQDVVELKPYCIFFDVTYSRLMDMGVDARETIGLGCETCSLRYKHGRETVIPPKLEGVLPGT